MILKRFLPFLLSFCAISSAAGLELKAQNRGGEAVLDIEPYKITCISEGRHPCMTGKMNGEKSNLDMSIQGFNFEWGFCYQLRIEFRAIPNPPADGPSEEYRMKKLLKKEPVPENYSFEYTLEPASDYYGFVPMVQDLGDDTLLLLGEIKLHCKGFKSRIMSELQSQPVKLLLMFNDVKELEVIEILSGTER